MAQSNGTSEAEECVVKTTRRGACGERFYLPCGVHDKPACAGSLALIRLDSNGEPLADRHVARRVIRAEFDEVPAGIGDHPALVERRDRARGNQLSVDVELDAVH